MRASGLRPGCYHAMLWRKALAGTLQPRRKWLLRLVERMISFSASPTRNNTKPPRRSAVLRSYFDSTAVWIQQEVVDCLVVAECLRLIAVLLDIGLTAG